MQRVVCVCTPLVHKVLSIRTRPYWCYGWTNSVKMCLLNESIWKRTVHCFSGNMKVTCFERTTYCHSFTVNPFEIERRQSKIKRVISYVMILTLSIIILKKKEKKKRRCITAHLKNFDLFTLWARRREIYWGTTHEPVTNMTDALM